MVKKITKKFISVLLTMCISFSLVSLPFAGTKKSAPIHYSASAGVIGSSLTNFGLTKLYTAGFTLCGSLLTTLADSTDCEEFQKTVSIVNKYVFGTSSGQAMAEIKALCNQILDELDQIDKKLDNYTAEMEKMMVEGDYNAAYKNVNDTWTRDVQAFENKYNVASALETYKTYLKVADEYAENTKTSKDVEDARNDLYYEFLSIYTSKKGSFDSTWGDAEKREAVFVNEAVSDALRDTINNMILALNYENNDNYADAAAQLAFYGLPFATDQYEYIKTAIDKQFTEIALIEMLYQEYLSQKGEYFEDKHPQNDPANATIWENYHTELTSTEKGFKGLNQDVTQAMSDMLERDLKVSIAPQISLKLEEFPKPEDAGSVVMHNTKYGYSDKSESPFVTENVKFNRVFTLTNTGINSFMILDGTQFDSGIYNNEIPDHLHMTRLVYKQNIEGDYDDHVENRDFHHLADPAYAVYSDGTNESYMTISGAADMTELFNTKAYALYGSDPKTYLADYLSYSSGYSTYILTPEYVRGSNYSGTQYVSFTVLDANSTTPGAGFQTTCVSAENIQEGGAYYNTAYAVIMSNTNKINGKEVFKQTTSVGTSGEGDAEILITADNVSPSVQSTQHAGDEITVRFKAKDEHTILNSLTMQRFNDASNKNNVTSSEVILTREQIENLKIDESGYYIYKFNAPYSDIKLDLNIGEFYKVNIIGNDGSTDLVSLDASSELFAEGDTVNIIADEKVKSLIMEYNNVPQALTLNNGEDGKKTASFVMPGCDVTLRYGNCDEHDFDSDGFCVNCKFCQPAEFNSSDHYEISNAGNLYWFAALVNGDKTLAEFDAQNPDADAIVMTNIYVNSYDDMSNLGGSQLSSVRDWTPIGTAESPYTGTFIGGRNKISGLYFKDSESDNAGFFGCTGSGADISQICIVNSYFEGNNCVGAILGKNSAADVTVQCCGSETNVTVKGNKGIAGIVGSTYGGTISDCYNAGYVQGIQNAGGIVGCDTMTNSTGKISNCFNAGTVSVGKGIRGSGDGTIENCYCLNGTTTDDKATTKTKDEFSSGEVAYLLNNGGDSFRQNIDNDEIPDDYPKIKGGYTGGYVYKGCACGDTEERYSNYAITDNRDSHFFIDGFCIYCGEYKPATLNEENYYEINNAGNLYWFASLVNNKKTHAHFEASNDKANAVLTRNITVNSNVMGSNEILAATFRKWTPIGGFSAYNYKGKFDGKNYTISGLYCKKTGDDPAGLFGITHGADIKNIGVINSHFESEKYAGGIMSANYSSEVNGCYSEAEVFGAFAAAGIAGYNKGGTISECYNTGTIGSNEFAGGVCGLNSSGTIMNCYNTGSVNVSDSISAAVGGVIGKTFDGTFINNYNIGSISARSVSTPYIGGVCGHIANAACTIVNCYNMGSINESGGASPVIGGICGQGECGYNLKCTIANCYFDSDVYTGDAMGFNSNCTITDVSGKPTEKFEGGEVAYHLSQGCTVGEGESAVTYDGSVWGQTLKGDNKQNYPVLGGKKVLTDCRESMYVNDIIIYGQSVTLDGTIGMNIYVDADDAYTDWTASFNDNEVEQPAKGKNGLYNFTYEVAAKDMEDNITFSLSNGDSVEVSVMDYLVELEDSGSTDTALIEIAEAMKTYGEAAKVYFDDERVEVVLGVTAENLRDYEFTKNDTLEGISYYGSSLILESETTVRHYFRLAEGQNIGNFTFKVNDVEVTPVAKQDYYYIDVKNISAEDLGTAHIVTVTDKGTDDSSDVISGYSALSYANTVLNSETADENLQNLVKTLYLYNQKALAYSESQEGGN